MQFTITEGDNRDTLKNYPDNYFDSIVTDPPYGIDFLGKNWDANTGALETYQECLRVLKPGGYVLAFSAARTYHHLAVTLEQAGFEIRDQIMWLYASGFPKAQDIGRAIQKRQGVKETMSLEEYEKLTGVTNLPKGNDTFGHSNDTDGQKPAGLSGKITIPTSPEAQQWAGWKTALKPAHEPICMARKPFKGSTIDNVLRNGLGALNIDATRIDYESVKDMEGAGLNWNKTGYETGGPRFIGSGDEHTAVEKPKEKKNMVNEHGRFPSNVLGEIEDYQKYFYCPKVSRRERHCGFEAPPPEKLNNPEEMKKHPLWDPSIGTNSHRLMKKIREHKAKVADDSQYAAKGNNHPTVKPVDLMRYLIRLVTPPNGKVLDPFCGSGSTGMAAVELGHEFTGCELDPAYVRIAETRIRAWNQPRSSGTTFEDLFEF